MIHLTSLVLVLTAATAQAPVTEFTGVSVAAAAAAAVNASPQVAAAQAHVAELQAMLEAERRSGAPQLTASHVDAPQGGTNGATIEQSLTTLGGEYTFTDAYQHGPAVAQARATLHVAESDLLETQRAERSKAIDRYYDALRLQAEAAAHRIFVADAQRDLEAARLRFRAGDAPRLDVVRAQVDLSRAGAALDAATTAADNALDALSVETGIDRGRLASVTAAALTPLPTGDAKVLVQSALAHRADLTSARNAAAAARAAVTVADRSGAPTVTLSAGYTQGVDSGTFVRGPSAAVQVGVPLGNVAGATTEAERARVRQADLRVSELERDIALEVSQALRTALAATRAVQSSSAAQRAAEEELRAVEIGYSSGASSSLDVAEARRVAAEAVVDTLQARYEQARATAQLREVIGS